MVADQLETCSPESHGNYLVFPKILVSSQAFIRLLGARDATLTKTSRCITSNHYRLWYNWIKRRQKACAYFIAYGVAADYSTAFSIVVVTWQNTFIPHNNTSTIVPLLTSSEPHFWNAQHLIKVSLSSAKTYEWFSNVRRGRQWGYAVCKLHRNRNRSASRVGGCSLKFNMHIYVNEKSQKLYLLQYYKRSALERYNIKKSFVKCFWMLVFSCIAFI